MIEQKTRIDAHLVVVSHVPYVERDGACWTNAVEWRILQIFTSHFREASAGFAKAPQCGNHAAQGSLAISKVRGRLFP